MRKLVLPLLGAAALLIISEIAFQPARAEDEKPYKIVDGKVDKATFNGYRRYAEPCLRCHGPDGAGSSSPPNLTDSLKKMSYDTFSEVCTNVRTNHNHTSN